MANKEEKIRQIVKFVKSHPESFASRTVLRRFAGSDHEFGEEIFAKMESNMRDVKTDDIEIDMCYDMIK